MDRAPLFAQIADKLPGVWSIPGNITRMDAIVDAWLAIQPKVVEPAWTTAGRSKIGEREIPGPKHNPWIIDMWQKLGAPWLKTDDADSPWCGGFMAWCLKEAGLPWPKNYPAAASFATWGAACKPQVGAIMVKARKGGNHVGQIVGETADKLYYKVLGGNQGNAVSIIDILKSDATAIRWPLGGGNPLNIPLPILPRGTIGASEA